MTSSPGVSGNAQDQKNRTKGRRGGKDIPRVGRTRKKDWKKGLMEKKEKKKVIITTHSKGKKYTKPNKADIHSTKKKERNKK